MTTIKVDRQRVIDTLTAKADAMEAENKEYDAARATFEKAEEKWKKDTDKAAIKHANKATEISVSFPRWAGEDGCQVHYQLPVNLLPKRPERDDFFKRSDGTEIQWHGTASIEEVRLFVRQLELGVDDTLNMSALKGVSQYL